MAKLMIQNSEIVQKLWEANSFYKRLKGLLGRTEIDESEALLIDNCNSVHTWFMKFPIDVIFVNQNFVVQKTVDDLKPWKLVLPVWTAKKAIELKSGTIQKFKIKKGDQLYVGS